MGSDGCADFTNKQNDSFNPHSRMGSDVSDFYGYMEARVVSIHTPAWGVTAEYQYMIVGSMVSIHTPAWGVTVVSNANILIAKFQSTLPHGE